MSATPGGSDPPSPGPSNSFPNGVASHLPDDQAVLEYLRLRGFKSVEQQYIKAVENAEVATKPTVSLGELVAKHAPNPMPTNADGKQPANPLNDPNFVLQRLSAGLKATQAPTNLDAVLASIGAVGAEEALSLDPIDKQEGFRDLEAWVDGSLDIYRPEFRPLLFPIFCHFYLDLISAGFKEAALAFFRTFSPSLATAHAGTLHHLSTLFLPPHVATDEIAKRFRSEKYVVRMSRSGFGLLIGWLTEGVGGEATGAGDGFRGELGRRGRAAVMRVVNDHLRFDVTSSHNTAVSHDAWETSTGLLSSLVPGGDGKDGKPDPQAFNASRGELKLGLPGLEDGLREETDRVLREDVTMGGVHPGGMYDFNSRFPLTATASATVPPSNGFTVPTLAELPPQPIFKSIDVKREVEKVRDARKRIRLDPAAYSLLDKSEVNMTGFDRHSALRAKALPSICAYTFHDAPDGVPCSTFSPDSSLVAAGFSESYIRLWSLKGEKLRGLRSDFEMSSIKDASSLKKIREKGASSTRKLVGHSGPVYSVAFDPLSGSAAPPRYLLSCSADSTARLWSLDTMTNVVAYRGHQSPVWDVDWSPRGTYFATGSRDRTARLWSTDRVHALRMFAGHLSDVDCVKFHPNSLYLATGSSDWTCRLWDVQRGSCVRVFVGHQGAITSMAMSPDGKWLASASEDLAINIWDLGSGKRLKKMTGHTAAIHSLAFSCESSMLVSGGADWTVRCWDVNSPGGLPPKPGALDDVSIVDGFGMASRGITASGANESGALPVGPAIEREEESFETRDLVATFPTKRTPVINVQFTPRNLCLVAGPFLGDQR